MNRTAIKVEGISKEYVIGGREQHGGSLREMLVSAAGAPFRRFRGLSGQAAEGQRIWALKDVSFELKENEVVGIIGPNGAGKSTLLKILSRITEPTEGRVEICGRVASLLEVGTGFHPELTGRENIYLNGAILGMTHAEIKRKFDEIVAFADIQKFLDTPVKRYSSGMYVRLAFSVAAHLEAEILLVDEVLAVGDFNFQAKCLNKMTHLASAGRTVLFVSHNLGAVRNLCSRAMLIDSGKVLYESDPVSVIETYLGGILADAEKEAAEWQWGNDGCPGDDSVSINKATVIGDRSGCNCRLSTDESFIIQLTYTQKKKLPDLRFSLQLITSLGEVVFTTTDHMQRQHTPFDSGRYTTACRVPGALLNTGHYIIRIGADIPGIKVIQDWMEVGRLDLVGEHGGGTMYKDSAWPGVISPRLEWEIAFVGGDSELPPYCFSGAGNSAEALNKFI